MKIGFFNSYALWGGGEKWHYDMIEYALNKGDECILFSSSAGELKRRVGHSFPNISFEAIDVGKYSYFNPIDQRRLFKKFKRHNLDILIFNSFVDIRAAARVAKKSGVKKNVLRVGTPIAPAQKKSYQRAFQSSVDSIVGISDEIISIFKQEAPHVVRDIPFTKISNGIDEKNLLPERKVHDIYTFGNCCRLTKQKGLPYLIKSVEILKRITPLPFRILIAGGGEDEKELKKLVEEKGLDHIFRFLGHVEKIQEFYNSLDALSFTSEYEGTARTILEAWSCEKPVISFNISSMKEMISQGRDGVLISPYDLEEYAQKMRDFLENPEQYRQMGKRGREKVLDSYRKKEQYGKWYHHLTSL